MQIERHHSERSDEPLRCAPNMLDAKSDEFRIFPASSPSRSRSSSTSFFDAISYRCGQQIERIEILKPFRPLNRKTRELSLEIIREFGISGSNISQTKEPATFVRSAVAVASEAPRQSRRAIPNFNLPYQCAKRAASASEFRGIKALQKQTKQVSVTPERRSSGSDRISSDFKSFLHPFQQIADCSYSSFKTILSSKNSRFFSVL